MKNKKILVIATGGTIATTVKNGRRVIEGGRYELFNPPISIDKNDFALTKLYCQFSCDRDFDIIQPYGILSENSNPVYLQSLLQTLLGQLAKKQYIGVVISHGTDTLAYSRALIENLQYKVHIDLPIEFAYAYTSMPTKMAGESDGEFKSRQEEWDGYKCFKAAVDKIIKLDEVKVDKSGNCYSIAPNIEDITLRDDVLILKVYPGLDITPFDISSRYRRVIIDGYHSCTMPVEMGKKLIDKGVKEIYVCTEEAFSEKYDSMKELESYASLKKAEIQFVTRKIPDIWAKLTLNLEV